MATETRLLGDISEAMSAKPAQPTESYEQQRARLSAAFDLVKPADNWKMPIDATVSQKSLKAVGGEAVVSEAVIYFAGCAPEFSKVGRKIRVQAIGYYMAVGA
jgi:hypothetical protein